MFISCAKLAVPVTLIGFLSATPASASIFFFSTGNPDGLMGTASRPDSPGKFEIESADDFALTSETSITSSTFTGLIPLNSLLSNIKDVRIEIYRVFPEDSNVGRTSGFPTFSTSQVPTRVNSPSDVELLDRDSASGSLTFTPGIESPDFTALNSVKPGGIHPLPGDTTGGNGPVAGEEVQFNVIFSTPFTLAAGHYFFVPQVELANGDFFWLSAPKPIVPPGTSFPPGFTDLQSWTRDQFLDPDWLRVGKDIVGGTSAPAFNATFSLSGAFVPEPSSWAMMLFGFAGLGFVGYRKAKSARLAIAA